MTQHFGHDDWCGKRTLGNGDRAKESGSGSSELKPRPQRVIGQEPSGNWRLASPAQRIQARPSGSARAESIRNKCTIAAFSKPGKRKLRWPISILLGVQP